MSTHMNAKSKSWNKLQYAVIEERLTSRDLEKHSRLINCCTEKGSHLLHFAALNNDVAGLRLLLAHSVGVNVNIHNQYGETALHWASKEGNLDVIIMLLDAGANVDICDGDGNSPLHWASEYGHVDVMKLLLSRGASLFTVNSDGHTPHQLAILIRLSGDLDSLSGAEHPPNWRS